MQDFVLKWNGFHCDSLIVIGMSESIPLRIMYGIRLSPWQFFPSYFSCHVFFVLFSTRGPHRAICHVSPYIMCNQWMGNDSLPLLIAWHLREWGLNKYGQHFADDIFKCIFLNEKFSVLPWISLKFVSKNVVDDMAVLIQVMAWCLFSTKPLPEPMLIKMDDALWCH